MSSETKRIALNEPRLGGNEWDYVKECLDTAWVSSAGGYVTRFEEEMGAYLGGLSCVAVSSGTAALHVSLRLAGVGRDDEVIVPALTFIAPAFAVRYLGAWPVILDVEAEHGQLDPEALGRFLERGCDQREHGLINRATGRRVAAMVPVHLLGHPVDMDPVLALAREHGLAVVEDATESLGARYKGQSLGGLGELGCLSFNGNKLITTGGGGMIVTAKPELAQKARHLTTQAKADPVEYVHRELGYNYRLTNLQAAMGCAQLERIGEHLAAKRAMAQRYASGLAGVPGLTLPTQADWAESAWWLYAVQVDPGAFGMDRRALREALSAEGVETRPLWQALSKSPALADCYREGCPVAEGMQDKGLCLPSSVGLTPDDQDRVMALMRGLAAGGGA